ncbi:MAG TPA: hypothetical protein VJY33_23885, partial [Isosphaeraceae bacterium]|nr:hypothetical protein [Isosphaeraceae bacterium]
MLALIILSVIFLLAMARGWDPVGGSSPTAAAAWVAVTLLLAAFGLAFAVFLVFAEDWFGPFGPFGGNLLGVAVMTWVAVLSIAYLVDLLRRRGAERQAAAPKPSPPKDEPSLPEGETSETGEDVLEGLPSLETITARAEA